MAEPRAWIDPAHPDWPEALRHANPGVRRMWFAGDPCVLGRSPRIGIVGSRTPRAEAAVIARRIARGAALLGGTIVSGLARGIDGIAHEQAVRNGAPTIGVLAGGLGWVHPVRHRALARTIAGSASATGVEAGQHAGAAGLLLSEYGAGTEPSLPHRFRERNRIIAALSDYLVVVQARHTSGSMITAHSALDLGVPIGVVPSAPEDESYAGSIELIQQGADAVVDGRSLRRRLELHGIIPRSEAPDASQLSCFEHPLATIIDVPRTLDEVTALAGLSTRDARMMLLELEGEGHARCRPDGTWVMANEPS